MKGIAIESKEKKVGAEQLKFQRPFHRELASGVQKKYELFGESTGYRVTQARTDVVKTVLMDDELQYSLNEGRGLADTSEVDPSGIWTKHKCRRRAESAKFYQHIKNE